MEKSGRSVGSDGVEVLRAAWWIVVPGESWNGNLLPGLRAADGGHAGAAAQAGGCGGSEFGG